MNAANRQSILIVEPNRQIREEIFNLLLSAGYEKIDEADRLATALDKISQATYETIVADAGEALTSGLQFATDLARLSPNTCLILMINAEDHQSWDQISAQSVGIRFLIKTDFARNLLYLLEEKSQP